MLPDRFEWRSHGDSHTLRVGECEVANYSQRPGAPYAVAYFHLGKAKLTARTFNSEAGARAYIEAWARRWHAELRLQYR